MAALRYRDTQVQARQRRGKASHFASRVVNQARILPATLWRGVRLWWSTKALGKEFWTFYGASFCFGLGGCIFFLLYNLYLLDCGVSEKLLGWLTSAMTIGTLAGTLPAGFLAQRIGVRKTLLLCFVLVPILSACRVVFISETPLLVLAFLAGAAMSIWAVCISPALAQLTTDRNRPFAFSLVFSSGIGVGFLGGLVGGGLPAWLGKALPAPASAHAMQLALLISSAIVGLGLWPTSRLDLPSAPAREKKFCPRNRFLMRFLPAIAAWSLVTNSLSPFFNVYFSKHLHMPVPRIGVVFSVAQLSQVLAILLAPLVYRKFGLVTGIMYTQLATALALACLAAVRVASAAAFIYVGYMAFQWMSEPGMYSLLMNEVLPAERSSASALNFFVISLASAIAAAFAGQGFARFGYPAVIGVTAVVAVLAALLFWLLLGTRTTEVAPAHSVVVQEGRM